jgi:hypothetical protein
MVRLVDQEAVLPFLKDVLEGKQQVVGDELSDAQVMYAMNVAAGMSEVRDVMAVLKGIHMKDHSFTAYSSMAGEFMTAVSKMQEQDLDQGALAEAFVRSLRPPLLLTETATFMKKDNANKNLASVKSFALRLCLKMDTDRRAVQQYYAVDIPVRLKRDSFDGKEQDTTASSPSKKVNVEFRGKCNWCNKEGHKEAACRGKSSGKPKYITGGVPLRSINTAEKSTIVDNPAPTKKVAVVTKADLSKVKCFKCSTYGHYAKNCP